MNVLEIIQFIPHLGIYQTDIELVILQIYVNLYKFIHVEGDYLKKEIIDKRNIIDFMISIIANNTYLSHIIYDDKLYYERTNTWCDTIRPDDTQHDIDVYCNLDESNTFDEIANKCPKSEIFVNSNEIKYVIAKSPIEYNGIENILENYSHDDVIFVGYKSILFVNASGINKGHNGSTHCKVNLECQTHVIFNHYITLNDLADMFYRIKSHKFNYWFDCYKNSNCCSYGNEYKVLLTFSTGGV